MRNLKTLLAISLCAMVFITSCGKESAAGGTIASQVTGTFMSTDATITAGAETIVESAENYMLSITEVDANTVSVISEHTPTFEVDLVKSENGELTTGTTNSGAAGFTFKYYVADGAITVNYSTSDLTMTYVGMKE